MSTHIMSASKISHTKISLRAHTHTHTHTHHKWKAAFVNWRQKGVVREYSVSATNPTETEGM